MDRNLILAFILSTAVVLGYYYFFPPAPPQQKAAANQQIEQKVEPAKQQAVNAEQTEAIVKAEMLAGSAERKVVKVETSLYKAEIDTLDGVLKSFYLKDYKYSMEPKTDMKEVIVGLFSSSKAKVEPYDPDRLVNLIGDVPENEQAWKLSLDGSKSKRMFHSSETTLNLTDTKKSLLLTSVSPSGLAINKQITFNPDSYIVDVKVVVANQTASAKEINPEFFLGAGNEAVQVGKNLLPKVGITLSDGELDKWDDDDFEKDLTLENFAWVGVMDTYFITTVKPPASEWKSVLKSQPSMLRDRAIKVPSFSLKGNSLSLAAGQNWTGNFQMYLGPKAESEMDKFAPAMVETLDFGWFSIIAHPLLGLLRWLQGYVVNWGVAIIILTIIVRVLMAPLALKGMMSMKRMSALNPKMKKLREKYKNDKERLNKEIMELYKKNGVNPMGGCLPMLLQIPIFIGLYQALLPALELRHASFGLWMTDLSAADHTLILPLLMGASMFFQQKLTPTANMDPTQAKMMKWFPVMMTFFFLDFPTGLVLYWVVSNGISILQQLIFNRIEVKEIVG